MPLFIPQLWQQMASKVVAATLSLIHFHVSHPEDTSTMLMEQVI